MIEKVERVSLWLDFYGGLLTEKQRQYLDFHYNQDMSLGEIAENVGVSRQAVHDIIKRGENLLQDYEQRLQLVERFNTNQERLNLILAKLTIIQGRLEQSQPGECAKDVAELREHIQSLLEQEE